MKIRPYFLLVIFLIFIKSSAKDIISLSFDPNDLMIGDKYGYTELTFASQEYKCSSYSFEPGYPEIPVIAYSKLIPYNKSVSSVKILSVEETVIQGDYYIFPMQKTYYNTIESFVLPDKLVYTINEKIPENIISITHTGNFGGNKIANFVISPIRYNPNKRKLFFSNKIDFEIIYENDNDLGLKPEKLFQQDLINFNNYIKDFVANPEDLDIYRSSVMIESIKSGRNISRSPSDNGLAIRYIIITQNAFLNDFQPLIEWKNKTGCTAELFTLDWIQNNVTQGVDDAETIRNFIKWAYQKWGTQYILLGGDTDIIPTRFIYTNNLTVSTDMYYSDLDGNWNYDGDSFFGEREDSLDYYPEVFVSRVPARTSDNVQDFVQKTLKYSKAIGLPVNYGNKILMVGSDLINSGDGAELCNFATNCIHQYVEKTLLAEGEVPGTTPQEVLNYINYGYNLIYSVSHGSFNSIMTEKQSKSSIYNYDLNNLSNTNFGIWLLSSCFCNQIELNSISKNFINAPDHGGVGYIGSTSVDASFVMNDLHQNFFDLVYNQQINDLSKASYLFKLEYLPWFSLSFNPWRFLFLVYNTLGDPQLSIWTNSINQMNVNLSDEIYLGENNLTVTVSRGVEPPQVNDATVCLYKEDDVWETQQTVNGQATFNFEVHTTGNIYITTTKTNYKPVEISSEVLESDIAHLRLSDKDLVEENNSNGKIESGESAQYQLFVENNGSETASEIDIEISCQDNFISLSNYNMFLEELEGEGKTKLDDNLSFSVSTSVPVDTVAKFDITFTYDENIDIDHFTIPIYSPDIIVSENSFVNTGAGEYQLSLQISNSGKGTSTSLQGFLTSDNPLVLDISPSYVSFESMEPNQSDWGSQPFQIETPLVQFSSIDCQLEIIDEFEKSWFLPLIIYSSGLSVPDNLTFLPKAQTEILLNWEFENSSSDMNYNIYRRIQEVGDFTKLNGLPVSGVCRFIDENITANQSYEYKIKAVDKSGNVGDFSNTITAWGAAPFQTGYPAYENDYRVGLHGDAIPFDFNEDGEMEIVTPGNNGNLIIYETDGSIYHEFTGLVGNLRTPAFGNVDPDSAVEMLVPAFFNGAEGNKIYVFDCSTLVLEQTLTEPNDFSLNNLALADINQNGRCEIFATGFGGNLPQGDHNKNKSKLFAWEYGREILELYASRVFNDLPYLLNTPALEDVNNDDTPEIILGFPDGTVNVLDPIYLGIMSQYECDGWIGCQVSIGDLDNNEKYDLVFTTIKTDTCLWALEYDPNEGLEEKWNTPISGLIDFFGFTPSPTLGDVDDDGYLEIALPTENYIYLFNHNGTALNNWPVEWNSGTNDTYPLAGISHAILGDIDGDEKCDLVIASSRNLLYGFDVESGDCLKGFPMKTGFADVTSPVIADIDSDDDMEIIYQEYDGWLFVMDVPDSYYSPKLEWPMRFANYYHSGSYNTAWSEEGIASSGKNTLSDIPHEFALLNNYPNPFNPITTIKYMLPSKQHTEIIIYNLLGQKIKTLFSGEQEPGKYTIEWTGLNDLGDAVASGIYIYQLKTKQRTITKKMLLLK